MGRIRSSRGFFVFFGVFWCLIVGVFDVIIGVQVYRQLDASRRFQPVAATIVESRVDSTSGSDGTTYRPLVRFQYEAGGRTHESDTVHYVVWGTSSSRDASEVVRRFPVGSETTAYFDPGDPSRAILLRGMQFVPSFVILFLTPFHCVGIGVWIGACKSRGGPYEEVVLRRAIRSDDGTVAVLRSSRVAPWVVFLSVIGVGAFLATFAVGFTTGFTTRPGLTGVILGGLTVVGLIAAIGVHVRRKPDVVLDRLRRTVGRPGLLKSDRFGVPHPRLGFDDIHEIAVERKTWGSVNDEPYYTHTLFAETGDLESRREIVRVVGPDGFADPLAQWVRTEIGIARG